MVHRMVTRFLVIACITATSMGQTLSQSAALTSDMLSGYDKRQRPVLDQSKPVVVNLTFDVVAIQDFDEVKEKFSVVGIVHIVWYDEQLKWNPASYGGIISQTFKPQDIWYPTLILANPYDKITELGDDWMVIRVYANGLAYFAPGDVFKATCSVDVMYYPFDTQTCTLKFIPWGFPPVEIALVPTKDQVQQTFYSKNGEWDLQYTSAEHNRLSGVDSMAFTFKIKRKPLFLLINVILPIIFMLIINVLVFVLPTESGERISYAVTVLLALAVFLTLVADNLPKTSEPMSILCYFLMLCLILSTLICVCTILNLRVYFKDADDPVPVCIAEITRVLKCAKTMRCNPRKKVDSDEETDIYVMDIKVNSKQTMPKWIPDTDTGGNTKGGDKPVTWKDVSSAMDTMCILMFVVAITMTTSIYVNILVNNKQGI